MAQEIVEIEHLDFAYRDQLVLKHIHLPIQRGSTLGLIGPNGGGKTTLIRLMLGLVEPTRGTIRIEGMSPKQAISRGDVIGYLPQNPSAQANFPLSVKQAVTLGLAGKTGLLKAYADDDLGFVKSLIDRVGLKDLAEEPVGSLSGGQLQRVFIARALAPRPKLLLLDEPTTGIDAAGQQRFMEFIAQLKEQFSLTIVFASHDLRTVSAISDRVACLNLTLHYHDVPEHLPPELAHQMFACDLEAMGIRGIDHDTSCDDCARADAESLVPPASFQVEDDPAPR